MFPKAETTLIRLQTIKCEAGRQQVIEAGKIIPLVFANGVLGSLADFINKNTFERISLLH